MMDCPECTQLMTQLMVDKPRSYTACIQWEKYRCEACKLTAKVEIVYETDEADITAPSIEARHAPEEG